ncbi:hypothetical protein NHX12_009848 [Muraenolepis orangiensis]|uniref:Interferon regulatory factor n=1 Tax=Muraenolepis orangiensis TaxID=630683 RepID=A0A9Q0DIE2_9TELE|nr:hypothetical protein NHX12_009848 [Muraenolepis orangiensis]
MPVQRMKMRPWLEQMIESTRVPGLQWVDKDQKMFSITWKHGARHGWQMDKDATLFKYWAIHTGKYKEGVDELDPKKWKANFRCAMNSLPDVEQVKNQSVNKGQQAVRVYKMVKQTKDKQTKSKVAKRRSKYTKASSSSSSESDSSETQQTFADQHASRFDDSQENTVDSTEQQDMACAPMEETWPDSTADLLRRFEVSPEHSPVYDDTGDIITFCQQLEQDANLMQSISYNMELLSNELCSDTNSSPKSQWSDTSSGDEIDIPAYTLLGTGNALFSGDPWGSHNTPNPSSFLL